MYERGIAETIRHGGAGARFLAGASAGRRGGDGAGAARWGSLLDDLDVAITDFETTREVTRAGEREHVGATADLWAVGSEIVRHMRLLDGLVRYRFGQNPGLMSAWASARSVGDPVRSKGEAG